MALALADRVHETSQTTGTGTLNLDGALAGKQTFVAGISSGNTCHYAVEDIARGDWEVGIGTVTSGSPDTLARTTILASSNGGSAVDFQGGIKHVRVTLAAARAGALDRIQTWTAAQTFSAGIVATESSAPSLSANQVSAYASNIVTADNEGWVLQGEQTNSKFRFCGLVGAITYAAIYLGDITPSATNFIIATNSGDSHLYWNSGPSSVHSWQVANVTEANLNAQGFAVGSGEVATGANVFMLNAGSAWTPVSAASASYCIDDVNSASNNAGWVIQAEATNAKWTFAGDGSGSATVWFGGPTLGTGTFMFKHLNGTAGIGPQINAPTGQVISFGINDSFGATFGAYGLAIGTTLLTGGSNVLGILEGAAPTGITNMAQLYCVDNVGKTELYVIFQTGAAILLAAEA